MNKEQILADLKSELKQNVDEEYRRGCQGFFKEDVKVLGVRAPVIRKIAKEHFKIIKDLKKEEIFDLCEDLLKLGYLGYSTVAVSWAYNLKDQYTKLDFNMFEQWVKKYVTNWATCDDLCAHPINNCVQKFPEVIPKVKSWSQSKNRWERRASAVSFISSNKSNKEYYSKNLNHIFATARTLLRDEDDLVQKGYGWMLKEASNQMQKEIFDFVMKYKRDMPRTALRYAIEKMPQNLKKKAMVKDW